MIDRKFIIPAFLVSAGLYVATKPIPTLYFGDFIAFAAVAALAWWLLSVPREPAGHEQADQGLALRSGKALNRIIRRWRQ